MRGIVILSVEQQADVDRKLLNEIMRLKMQLQLQKEISRSNLLLAYGRVEEVRRLQVFVQSLADRCHKQSELLSRRAARANTTGDEIAVSSELENRDRAENQGEGGEPVREVRGAELPVGGADIRRPSLLARFRQLFARD